MALVGFNEKDKEEYREKLIELGLKDENSFVLGMKRASFIKEMIVGSFAKKQFLVGVDSQKIIMIELKISGKLNLKKEAIIFKREDVDIKFKKGILLNKLIVTEKNNPKSNYRFDIYKVAIGLDKEGTRKVYREITGMEY